MSNRTLKFVIGLGLVSAWAVAAANAQTVIYNDRSTFEATLGAFIADSYSDVGYTMGDVSNGPTLDIHSNTHMSAVIGETDYTTTSFNDPTGWNLIVNQPSPMRYCAGCNGSFLLSFLTTSVGTANGVFGAGIDIATNSSALPYHAFITYGDSTTQDVALPAGVSFFGVTSTLDVESIHFGLAGGGRTTSGSFVMDDLTIGAAIPEPAALSLLSVGALMLLRRRR